MLVHFDKATLLGDWSHRDQPEMGVELRVGLVAHLDGIHIRLNIGTSRYVKSVSDS